MCASSEKNSSRVIFDGALVAGDRAGLVDVLAELVRVDALGVGDVAADVADADDDRALLREQARGVAADVAEALDDDVRAVEVEVLVLRPLGDAVNDALAGRLGAAVAAAGGDALAGDDAADRVAVAGADDVHVRVHHPDHRLAVGVHVGRRDVEVGADVAAERRGEAARDALELGLAVLARVELDAALAAAERDLVERALVRHPRRERLHLVEVGLVVVAHAALVRAEDVVVLDAVALEHLDTCRCHADREVDDQLVLGLAEDLRRRR